MYPPFFRLSSPPSPPSPPSEGFSTSVFSTLDLGFLCFAVLSGLALAILPWILACCQRKYSNRSRDIEIGEPQQTVAQPPASSAADTSSGSRRASSTALILTRLFQYGDRGIEGKNADCSICLDEFTEGEVCRMLPKCKHVFHRFCIDQWLPNERRCPLCRSPVRVRIIHHPQPS